MKTVTLLTFALSLRCVLCFSLGYGQAAQLPDTPSPVPKPPAPAVLPGEGLRQHDFFYAGEARTRDMYIVRKGEVAWEYHDNTSKGEISDAVLLSNGNILFAHQFGVTLLSPGKNTLWHLEAPPKTEIHTAVPIGLERVLYVQNGDPAKAVVVNLATGLTEKEFVLPVRNPQATHLQFRHARITGTGTLLVAHRDLGKVCEYDADGKEIWSVETGGNPWSAARLETGNTLVCASNFVREVDPKGATVWAFTAADVPEYQFASMQIATRLSGGNTLINNWVNQWSGRIDPATAPVQALEITPDKKVVWALRAWDGAVDLGPATTIQVLDQPTAPEAVRFGAFR